MTTPAEELLSDQAWALFCRGAELQAIAQALNRPADDIARWLAGRVPEGSDIQAERHKESLRGQLRALNADLPNATGARRAQMLASINRIEGQLYASERPRLGPARAEDWRAQAPPAFRDVDTIRRATVSAGLKQCRYVDQVALRLGTSGEQDDVTAHVAWLRDKAARDCIGCPAMRKTHRCSMCGQLTAGERRCQFHPQAPLEAVPQPFKWCLTVHAREVGEAMRGLRDRLPEQYFAQAHYHSKIAADRGVVFMDALAEMERSHRAQKRELQRLVHRLENGEDSPALREEFRDANRLLNQTADLIVDVRIRLGLEAGGKLRPGQINNYGNLAVISQSETNVSVGAGPTATAERVSEAMRRNPKRIPEMLAALDRITRIMDGEEPKEIIDVAGQAAPDAPADRKAIAPRGSRPAGAAPGRVGKGRRAGAPDRAPKKASA